MTKKRGKTIKVAIDPFFNQYDPDSVTSVLEVSEEVRTPSSAADLASQHVASVQASVATADALTSNEGLQMVLTKDQRQKLIGACSVQMEPVGRFGPSGIECSFKSLPLGALFVFKVSSEGPLCMKVGNTSYLHGLFTSVPSALPHRLNLKDRASGKDRVIVVKGRLEYADSVGV